MKEQPMITDPTITRIGHGVELHHHRGQPEAARDLFTAIWDVNTDHLVQLGMDVGQVATCPPSLEKAVDRAPGDPEVDGNGPGPPDWYIALVTTVEQDAAYGSTMCRR
ncbi:hypothetical protein ACFYO0_45045 [Streptomyces sp. NPDC006365]|uniref:hypothetical protein n=1 Tax=Streptomyces sp. NPDC006365 TaxID=3364744 RepID=UPI0036D0F311